MATTALHNYLEETKFTVSTSESNDNPPLRILEAHAGSARSALLERYRDNAARSGARCFLVSCSFDLKGPWGGVNDLFPDLLPEIRLQRPDLIERHSFELVSVLPELRRTLNVRNPNLTDLAEGTERTRNYPADRAYRIAHGLIDLLDGWKTKACPETPWFIACDSFDLSGAMGGFFFRELLRRRGSQLNLRLLIGVASGKGAETVATFDSGLSSDIISVDLPLDPSSDIDPSEAQSEAEAIEERIAGDPVAIRSNLSDLIRFWRAAGNSERLLQYKFFGLEAYNTAGLYVDALRYGEGLLDLAAHHMPTNDFFRWSILLKLIMSHLGLEQVESAMKLASEEGEPLAAKHAEIRVDLYYLLSMLSSRFTKPRDFKKGEDYLERGLEAIEQAHLPEGERHFKTVFNRNGLAMIRNFQHRHQEAIELCRTGIERLEQHLSGDQHRLHRSILFYNMAQVYAAIGSSDEAIRYYSVAMQMDQNYSEYYNDRGNVYLKLGLLDEAKADYLTAIELSPPYFEVFANLGQCYRRMGQMELAIESYSRALDLEPNHALALLGRAKAQEELGNGPLAINDYSAALKLDPTMWEAFASRAFLLYDTGDLAQSLADLNKAIELKNDSADLYQNRAILLTDLKQFDKALGDLQKAVRLTSNLQDRLTLEEEIEKVAALADFDTIPR